MAVKRLTTSLNLQKINNAGDLELSSNQNNSIQYFPQFNIFILSVNKSPFNEGRVEVENEFLQKLGIDKNCLRAAGNSRNTC